MSKQKSALVLSGGGSLGIAHVGAIEALEDTYEFDSIYGVSAGAIIGAGIAVGKSTAEISEILTKTNLFKLGFDFSMKNHGLVQGRRVHAMLDEIYEGKNIEDLAIPLVIGTTDFETGKRVMLRQGKIADAVRASMAIPIVFEPFYHPVEQKFLVDGFLSQNLPLDLAQAEYQGDRIIAVDVATIPPLPQYFGHKKLFGSNKIMFNALQRTFRIMYQNQQRNFVFDPRTTLYTPDLSDFSSMSIGRKNFEKIKSAGQKCVKDII